MSQNISHLNIGPIRFVLHGEQLPCMRYGLSGYDGFFSDRLLDESPRPLAEMAVEIVQGGMNLPETTPLYECGKNWSIWLEEDHLLFCARYMNRERPLFSCRVSRDLKQATLSVDGDPADAPLRYPLDQILSWGLLARCGGMILHSAVVVKDGVGWVFSGRSGAGKTTISELCHNAGWNILNDDRVMVFKREGSWKVAGTPWHGSGRFAEAQEVPLGGVLFVEKSDHEQIVPMSADEIRYALLDVTAIPWFEDEWAQGALDVADLFTREVSFHRFHCRKNPAVVQTLEEFLQNQKSQNHFSAAECPPLDVEAAV